MLTTLVDKRLDLGNRAPIVEALLDFRVSPKDNLDLSVLKEFGAAIINDFPDSQIQTRFSSEVNVDDETIALGPISTSTLGYAYVSPDATKIAQVQVGGFSFSKLKPYEGWTPLFEEFRRLWELYLQVAQPLTVKRMAVRFINKLPLASKEKLPPSSLLGFHPTTPESVAKTREFFMRTVNVHPELPDIRSIVTVASEDVDNQHHIIFDIDAFSADLSIDPASDQLWDILLQLREYKNDLFFGSITPLLESFLV